MNDCPKMGGVVVIERGRLKARWRNHAKDSGSNSDDEDREEEKRERRRKGDDMEIVCWPAPGRLAGRDPCLFCALVQDSALR